MTRSVTDDEYARLLEFRTGLRRFLRWSEEQAERAGLSPAQHQLLLAVRGHPDRRGPTVGEIADYLVLRPHSAVELIDRATHAGLVARHADPDDRRVVRVVLTETGETLLGQLSRSHLDELKRLGPTLQLWAGLSRDPRPTRRPEP